MKTLRNIRSFVGFIVLIFSVSAASSADGSPVVNENGPILTIQEAIDNALAMSRKAEFLSTEVEISELRLDSARSIDNPELRLREQFDIDDSNDQEFEVGVRWDIPRFGATEEAGLEAGVRHRQEVIQLQRYRLKRINRVRNNYFDVLLKDQLVDLAHQRLDLETRRLKIIEHMVTLGHRSIVYLTKSRMWLAESRHEYNRSVMRQKAARRKLARITGSTEDVQVMDTIDPYLSQPIDELAEIAFDHRPEIELATYQERLAVQQLSVEKLKRIPRPRFIDVTYGFDEKDKEKVELQMGIELPIFNRNRGNITASQLAVRRKEYQANSIREQILEEINDAHEVYTDCLIDWQSFSNDLAGMITETQTVIDQADDHDVLAPDEVIELDLVLLDIQKILAEKRRRLLAALSDLHHVLGVESFIQTTSVSTEENHE